MLCMGSYGLVMLNSLLLYYNEASVQNNVALLTCVPEDPFRISHGTRTIFTEGFLGFPHSVKANVGKAL